MDGHTVASPATVWSPSELESIARTDDLHISPFREDGKTYGTPTWIWSVVVDGDLYVRGYIGQQSRWYQAALAQKAGRAVLSVACRIVVRQLRTIRHAVVDSCGFRTCRLGVTRPISGLTARLPLSRQREVASAGDSPAPLPSGRS